MMIHNHGPNCHGDRPPSRRLTRAEQHEIALRAFDDVHTVVHVVPLTPAEEAAALRDFALILLTLQGYTEEELAGLRALTPCECHRDKMERIVRLALGEEVADA
jgi:hypothetical protein